MYRLAATSWYSATIFASGRLIRLSRTVSRKCSSLEATNSVVLGTDVLSHGRQFPDSSHPALCIGRLVANGGIVTGGSLKNVSSPFVN